MYLLLDFLLKDTGANQYRFVTVRQALRRDDGNIEQPLPVVPRIGIHEGADVDAVEPAGGQKPLSVRAYAPHENRLAISGGPVDELANTVVHRARLVDILTQA